MPWRRKEPGHHHPWYGLYWISCCFTWGWMSTTWVMLVWRNGINCTCIFKFPVKNVARKGLRLSSSIDYWAVIELFCGRQVKCGTKIYPSECWGYFKYYRCDAVKMDHNWCCWIELNIFSNHKYHSCHMCLNGIGQDFVLIRWFSLLDQLIFFFQVKWLCLCHLTCFIWFQYLIAICIQY